MQILACVSHQLKYINTIGQFGGDVAVHMWKIQDLECKVIFFIVGACCVFLLRSLLTKGFKSQIWNILLMYTLYEYHFV